MTILIQVLEAASRGSDDEEGTVAPQITESRLILTFWSKVAYLNPSFYPFKAWLLGDYFRFILECTIHTHHSLMDDLYK